VKRTPIKDIGTMNALFPKTGAIALQMDEQEPGTEQVSVLVMCAMGVEPAELAAAARAEIDGLATQTETLGCVAIPSGSPST
jgi:hypothetical protein